MSVYDTIEVYVPAFSVTFPNFSHQLLVDETDIHGEQEKSWCGFSKALRMYILLHA